MSWVFPWYEREKNIVKLNQMIEMKQSIEDYARQEKNRMEQDRLSFQRECTRLNQEKKSLQEECNRLSQKKKNLQEECNRLEKNKKNLQKSYQQPKVEPPKAEQPKVEQKKCQPRVQTDKKTDESKKQLQAELVECSKTIREMQRMIKELYQFEPCRQLCELEVNIQQGVYHNISDIEEELEYILEEFGITVFEVQSGDSFDARYHEQVYSNEKDARGRRIDEVYSKGYTVDGEVILKAQVSVK